MRTLVHSLARFAAKVGEHLQCGVSKIPRDIISYAVWLYFRKSLRRLCGVDDLRSGKL